MADPQLLQRAADLGQSGPGDLPAGLGRVEVMAAPVRVELDEQPMPLDHLGQATEGRGGALLLDQHGGVERRGRVIQRDHQVERRLPGQPGMRRGILVQHHADHRPALRSRRARLAHEWALCRQAAGRHRPRRPCRQALPASQLDVACGDARTSIGVSEPSSIPGCTLSRGPTAQRRGVCATPSLAGRSTAMRLRHGRQPLPRPWALGYRSIRHG